jgi:hypothetical protein
MWLETSLVPTLVKGQVVVMDNATFHKGGRIQEVIQSVGFRIRTYATVTNASIASPKVPNFTLGWLMSAVPRSGRH